MTQLHLIADLTESELITWAHENCGRNIRLTPDGIINLLGDRAVYDRTRDNHRFVDFTLGQRFFTLDIEVNSGLDNPHCVLRGNIPQGSRPGYVNKIDPAVDLVESAIDPDKEQFLFLMRDTNGVLSHCYRPWSYLEAVKHLTNRWEVQRIDGGDHHVIAQSAAWASKTVGEVMGNRHSETTRIIDGLRVELRGNRTHIYFQVIRHSYSPYVEITMHDGGRKTMAVIGSVSDFNFDGFQKAVEFAKSMICAVSIFPMPV